MTTELATLENDAKDFGFTFRFQTGKVFHQVFTGDEDAPAVLSLVNSTVSKQSSNIMLLGTSTQIIFSVSVSLRAPDGSKHILSATGAGSTAWTIDRAAREAVERAVIDLAAQVKAALATD